MPLPESQRAAAPTEDERQPIGALIILLSMLSTAQTIGVYISASIWAKLLGYCV